MHHMHEKRTDALDESAANTGSLKSILAQLFAQAEHAVLVADAGRRICFANAAALALFRCQESQMVDRKASDFFAEAQDLASAQLPQGSADPGQGYRRYLGCRHRGDGSTFYAQTLVSTIRDPRHDELLYVEVIHEDSIWSGFDQVLHALRGVVFDPGRPFDERRRALLAFGCEHFGTRYGAISQLTDNRLTVIDAAGADAGFAIGTVFDRGDTYCDYALEYNAAFRRDGLTRKRIPARLYGGGIEIGCYIGCPIHVGRSLYGTLYFAAPEAEGLFGQADMELIAALARWVGQEIGIARCIALLEQAREQFGRPLAQAQHDGDRRRLQGQLQQEIERAREQQQPVSIALLSVDHFDSLDTQYGDGAAAAVLNHVAALCSHALRTSDEVGRWGDDELILLLPDTSRAQAQVTVERLLKTLRGPTVVGEAMQVNITASVGVAESTSADSAQLIIHRADIARHLARSNGRDRVETG